MPEICRKLCCRCTPRAAGLATLSDICTGPIRGRGDVLTPVASPPPLFRQP